ncbi:AraC family transcriptional regulator [Streptomyces sp. NPDC052811]|uniref:AraC family transcriptional regulator n=1 Tax=Streptomyces sp. NPDC052811 TaxID=3155731 RepID=UPI00343E2940
MLPENVFRSSALEPTDRFGMWRDFMAETHAPMDLRSEHAAEFWVNHRNISLGEVTVYPLECFPLTFRRTPKLISKSDPEAFHLSLVKRGTGMLRLGKETLVHGAFDYHTSDTSRSFELSSGPEPLEIIGVEIPKAILPMPRHAAAQVIGRRLSARTGIGSLLATFLTQIAKESHTYQAGDGPRLSTVLADLMASLFAGALDADRSLTPETHRRTSLLRIKSFIRNNSDSSELDVAAVAAAHHISVSYLHRLFQQEGEGTTVAGFLLEQRLTRARRDLADPLRQDVPVHVIAARRGFSHAAAFSRAFKNAYGMPPTAFRRQFIPPTGAPCATRPPASGESTAASQPAVGE